MSQQGQSSSLDRALESPYAMFITMMVICIILAGVIVSGLEWLATTGLASF
jgi:hypothetical protein